MNCGLFATIIEYRQFNDIDIQFEDGIIIKHKTYANFRKGYIGHPYKRKIIKRLEEKKIMNCGLLATIIEYRKFDDIDIQFEDGIVVKHKKYDNFRKGHIGHHYKHKAKKRLGEKRIMNCGLLAIIIEYRKYNDIDIQFEDGIIVRNKSYGSFKNGEILHPDKKNYHNINILNKFKKERLGEKKIMNCGLSAIIINYYNNKNIDIKFEDGILIKHKSYKEFKNRNIKHPFL